MPRFHSPAMRRLVSATAILGVALVPALVIASPAAAATLPASAKYCQSQGGTVQLRTPAYGTNNTTTVQLAGKLGFCRFKSAADGSRTYVSLATLVAPKPTLAVLAYLEKPPASSGAPSANPASLYCSQVGGSNSFGGINAAGGGWVL